MSSILGLLLIVAGILIIISKEITIGLGVGIKLDEPMNYIVALPEILLGLYILYLNHNRKSHDDGD